LPPFHSVPTRPSTRFRRTGAVALVALALAAGGCSSSDSSSPAAAPTTGDSQAGGAAPVDSKVVLGKVAGTVQKKNRKVFVKDHRRQMLKQVGHAVDSWIDGGFVGVDYPRDSFASAFDAFTEPAKHDAKHQKKLMTNWALRTQIDGVDAKKRKVTVDVLAPRGRPAGATARVALVFTTSGDVTKRVTVKGRLFLSPGHGRWRIFGYDVSRGTK
jgi:hypothetical protein